MDEEQGKLIDGLLGMARQVLGLSRSAIGQMSTHPEADELSTQARQLREQGRDLVAIAEAILLVAGSSRST